MRYDPIWFFFVSLITYYEFGCFDKYIKDKQGEITSVLYTTERKDTALL